MNFVNPNSRIDNEDKSSVNKALTRVKTQNSIILMIQDIHYSYNKPYIFKEIKLAEKVNQL